MRARLLVELHYAYANTHTPTDATLIVGILASSRSVHVELLIFVVFKLKKEQRLAQTAPGAGLCLEK